MNDCCCRTPADRDHPHPDDWVTHFHPRRSPRRALRFAARSVGPLAWALVLGLLSASAQTQRGASAPDRPARGAWDFSPTKVWEITHAGDRPLARPAELRAAPGGAFYVHDFDRRVSYAFDGSGQLIRAFAGEGTRPGDVSRYMNCLTGSGRVVILTPESLHFYTADGEYIRSVPSDLFQRFPLFYLGGDGFLFGPGALTEVRGAEARIEHTDVAANVSAEFVRIPVSDRERQGPPGALVLGLIPQVLVARDPADGTIFYGKNSEYRIHAVDAAGRPVTTFGIDRPGTAVTAADKRAQFAGRNIPSDRVDQLIAMLPDQAVHYYRIEVHHRLVYVLPVVEFGRTLTRQPIDIFSRSGEYLYQGTLAFEAGKYLFGNPDNLRIQDDHLLAVLEDASGRRTIAKYALKLPLPQ